MLSEETSHGQIEIPVYKEDYLPAPVYEAVSYSRDENIFRKLIDLDKCDRASFESLQNNIMFLRKLSSYPDLAASLQIPTSLSILGENLLEITFNKSPFGSLRDYMERSPENYRFEEGVLCKIAAKIAKVLNSVHKHMYLFRALNPYHVLLFNDDSTNEFDVKLCGTGSICKRYAFRNDLPLNEVTWRGWHYNHSEQNPIVWYSPEVLLQDYTGYDQSCDIYSFGLLIASLFTGKAPFSDCSDPAYIFLKKLTEGPDTIFHECEVAPSEQLLDLFQQCTIRNPSLRISSSDLLEHPWIKKASMPENI